MQNCIFNAHCSERTCDNSCPILVETSYLLERNGITMHNKVFNHSANSNNMTTFNQLLDTVSEGLCYVQSSDTVSDADLLTYLSICRHWKGSQLHCTVYNLRFSQYLDALRSSWSSNGDMDALEYSRIWSITSKVLIVSNIDYVRFGDFESQTLLNIIQQRKASDKLTLVVGPNITRLVSGGQSTFFTYLKGMFDKLNGSGRYIKL